MSTDHDTLSTLATVPTEVEGQLLAGILRDRGIEAFASGGFTAGFRAEAPGTVQVLVKQEDLPAAKVVLAEHQKGRTPRKPSGKQRRPPEPTLTRFGVWCLLVCEVLVTVGILAAWTAGTGVTGPLAGLVVSVIVVAGILTWRWLWL